MTGDKKLPREVEEQIIEKADGVPLFVEELTKTVLESELVQDVGDRYVAIWPPLPFRSSGDAARLVDSPP